MCLPQQLRKDGKCWKRCVEGKHDLDIFNNFATLAVATNGSIREMNTHFNCRMTLIIPLAEFLVKLFPVRVALRFEKRARVALGMAPLPSRTSYTAMHDRD